MSIANIYLTNHKFYFALWNMESLAYQPSNPDSPILLISLVGCSKTGADKVVGTWSADPSKGSLIIEKNGERYTVTDTTTSKPLVPCSAGATYDQGKLDCGTGLSFVYDDKTDKLSLPSLGTDGNLTSVALERVK